MQTTQHTITTQNDKTHTDTHTKHTVDDSQRHTIHAQTKNVSAANKRIRNTTYFSKTKHNHNTHIQRQTQTQTHNSNT